MQAVDVNEKVVAVTIGDLRSIAKQLCEIYDNNNGNVEVMQHVEAAHDLIETLLGDDAHHVYQADEESEMSYA